MAKIMYGNYNDLPWMPNHRKDVDGKVMCYMKCFAMEAANMHMCIGKMYNGMPIGPHTHPNEQIATVVKGECDYWVDGVPYRLAPGCWVNVPPHYVHYAHVYRSQGPCYQMDIMSPKRSSSCDEYKAWLKAEFDIDWDAGGREVPDLTEPARPGPPHSTGRERNFDHENEKPCQGKNRAERLRAWRVRGLQLCNEL